MAKKSVVPDEDAAEVSTGSTDVGSDNPAEGVSTGSTDGPSTTDGQPDDGERAEHRFFGWIRGLGLTRGEGWIGGVCSGIAARTGLDPILVRGIAIVVALLGGPIVLLYAAAWLLLPGPDGLIHAQDLGRGHITRAHAGIGGLLLLSFLPLTQGFWYVGAQYWGEPDFFASAGRIVWSAVVIVLAVLVIVWVARRSATAPSGVAPASAPAAASAAASGAAAASASAPTTTPPAPEPHTLVDEAPPTAPVGSSPEELAAWQETQAAWQQQRAQWAAAEAERRRQAVKQVAEEAAERRRIRQATRPRASAAVVGLIVGVALLVGGIAVLIASANAGSRDREWGVGIAAATIAVGIGIVVVGLARRRSGVLAFLGIVGLLATAVGIALPADRQLLPPTGYGISSYESGDYAQIGGQTSLYVNTQGPVTPPVIDLWQLGGSVNINLDPGATVQVELISASRHGYVQLQDQQGQSVFGGTLTATGTTSEGESVHRALIGSGTTPDLIVRMWLGFDGYLTVNGYVADQAEAEAFTVTPQLTDLYTAEDMVELPDGSSTPAPTETPLASPTPTPSPIETGAP